MKLSVRGMLQTEEPASTSTETCEKCMIESQYKYPEQEVLGGRKRDKGALI